MKGLDAEMLAHNCWATQRLLEFCDSLEPQILEKTAPGTAGSIIVTLRHLIAAEERYLAFLEGVARRTEVMEAADLALSELRTEAAGRAERWERALGAHEDPDEVLVRRRPDGTEDRVAAKTVFVQAVHHGNDHRTHVCTVLGSLGLDPPDLSAWAYYGEE